MRLEKRDLPRQALGQRNVIGVEPRDQRGPGDTQPVIQGAREPLVLPSLDSQSRIADAGRL